MGGSLKSPKMTYQSNIFSGLPSYYYIAPCTAEWLGNGVKDVITGVGYANPYLWYCTNTGTSKAPKFSCKNKNSSPISEVTTSTTYVYYPRPTTADIDHNGQLDLIIGAYYGLFTYYVNKTPPPSYHPCKKSNTNNC